MIIHRIEIDQSLILKHDNLTSDDLVILFALRVIRDNRLYYQVMDIDGKYHYQYFLFEMQPMIPCVPKHKVSAKTLSKLEDAGLISVFVPKNVPGFYFHLVDETPTNFIQNPKNKK